MEQGFQAKLKGCVVFGLTFPDNQDSPPKSFQRQSLPSITRHILPEFLIPEGAVRLWCVAEGTGFVAMPEATMDEHHCIVTRKHNVRLARQIRSV
jgi:hypothetical protein